MNLVWTVRLRHLHDYQFKLVGEIDEKKLLRTTS